MTNCSKCKDILKYHDGDVCNKCLMEYVRANRPTFIKEQKNYPDVIRATHEWDKERMAWVAKT